MALHCDAHPADSANQTTSLMSRRKYGVSERLVRRWGITDPGLAKAVVISAAAVSTVQCV
ncbi:hypothetical protein V1523DRAFT_417640, partial [Lipomyces doorenjongii]